VTAEKEALQWLETLSGRTCQLKEGETLVDLLRYHSEYCRELTSRSGEILCKAMQAISPNSIPKAFNQAPKHYKEEQVGETARTSIDC
jgi:hypothetical protein